MSRMTKIAPEQATGRAKELLEQVKGKLGMVPNMMRAMANSPAVLEAYLQFSGALAKTGLSTKVREQIALAVGEQSHCAYCVAAHSALGKAAGLTPDQIRESRLGHAVDSRTDAALRLARRIVETRGEVTDSDIDAARDAKLDDAAIAEVTALTSLNLFTNYFNHLADVEIDFPKAEPIKRSTVGVA